MTGRINEKVTGQYTAQLVDETGANIALASISTLTLTLYEKESGTIINGRNAQNVLNANNVTVSIAGFITWDVQPDDNGIVNDASDTEAHIALWKGTYGSGGSKDLKHEFVYRVVNLSKVS